MDGKNSQQSIEEEKKVSGLFFMVFLFLFITFLQFPSIALLVVTSLICGLWLLIRSNYQRWIKENEENS